MTVNVEFIVTNISAAHSLDKKLTNLEGVHAVEVNSEHERIKVEYNPDDISLEDLCTYIEKLGIHITY